MIQVYGLSKSFGDRVLFQDVTFTIADGERVGLVGRNGHGKSTLFRIIRGDLNGDGGEISIPKGQRLAYVDQHIQFSKPTILEECIESLPLDEQYDFYKAEKILFGLGFSDDDLAKAPESFSGGYQVRLQLAKALLASPDILLLDEPTNYLDIVSIRWFKKFLKTFPGEVLLITHDRDFMDDVVTHVMGIHRKGLRKIKGKTQDYYEQIALDEEIYEKTRSNQEKKIKHMESFVERFRAKASKATQAQSRLKMLQKMDVLQALDSESSMGLQFSYQECPGKIPLNISDLSFHYEEQQNDLFNGLSFSLKRNDCIGIVGKNGKGKSTLLKMIAGELSPLKGSIETHSSLQVGYFGQTNVERLHPQNTIVQEISSANEDLGHTQVRAIAGAMMFEGEEADKKISVLSGGEKARVLLGKVMANKTNLLLLDEPTNHLDMESVEVLCERLEHYPGAIILVTHNELLLQRLANRLIVFHQGNAEYFYGGYEDFIEKIGWEEEEKAQKKTSREKLSHKEYKKRRSEIVDKRAKELKPLNEKIKQLEDKIDSSETTLKHLQLDLIKASQESNGAKINELSIAVNKLESIIEESFTDLGELTEKCDKMTSEFDKLLSELEELK